MVLKHEGPLKGYHRQIGGSAGAGTHGGPDVEQPTFDDGSIPTRSDADYRVSNYNQLEDACSDAGATIYIDDDINMTGGRITLADGITLVGQYCDPSVDGPGNELKHPDNDANDYNSFFRHGIGTPTKLYGVSMRGPREYRSDPDHEADDFEDLLVYGLWERTNVGDGLCEIVGCRFTGFTHAGVVLGTKNRLTEADIRKCSFHMNNANHYGYGVEQYNGDLLIKNCFFDDCRHWTAGFGWHDEETDIVNCVGGPGPGLSHAWDKHGLHNNISGDDNTAGHHLRMRNCTTMQTELPDGRPQEAVKIRGVPVETSWFRNCHFYHEDPPSKSNPNQIQVIRQENDEWENVDTSSFDTNHYGSGGPPKGIGAPPAENEPEPEPEPDNGDNETMDHPYQRLIIHGGSDKCDYKLLVDGEAELEEEEKSDAVTSTEDGTVIEGHVYGNWYDVFHIEMNAEIVKATFNGSCTVAIDGHTAQLASAVSHANNTNFE